MTRSELYENEVLDLILVILSCLFLIINLVITINFLVIPNGEPKVFAFYDFRFWFLKLYLVLAFIVYIYNIDKFMLKNKLCTLGFILLLIIINILPAKVLITNYNLQNEFYTSLSVKFEQYNNKTGIYKQGTKPDEVFMSSALKEKYKEYVLMKNKEKEEKNREIFNLDSEIIGNVIYGRF